MSSLVNFYREIEKSKREPKELKCVICKKDILDDSQFINGEYYHNSCIENLQKQNTELKEENKKLKEQIQEYNDAGEYIYKLEDNWNKLKEWLEEESKLKGSETAYLYYGRVKSKMQEIEGGMNDRIF